MTSQPGMADPAPMCQDLMAFQGHVCILEGLCEDKRGASGVRAALHVAQTDQHWVQWMHRHGADLCVLSEVELLLTKLAATGLQQAAPQVKVNTKNC